jgi:hypothetical protein
LPRVITVHRNPGRGHEKVTDLGKADDFLRKVEHDRKAHVFIDPNAGKVTFRAEAEAWLANRIGADSSDAAYRSVLRTLNEVPVADRRDMGGAQALGDRDHRGVRRAQREVGVLPHEVGHPGEVLCGGGLGDQLAMRQQSRLATCLLRVHRDTWCS